MNNNSNEIILATAPVVFLQERTEKLMQMAQDIGYARVSSNVCLCFTPKEEADYGENTGFYVTRNGGYTSDSDLTFDEVMDELEETLIDEYNL